MHVSTFTTRAQHVLQHAESAIVDLASAAAAARSYEEASELLSLAEELKSLANGNKAGGREQNRAGFQASTIATRSAVGVGGTDRARQNGNQDKSVTRHKDWGTTQHTDSNGYPK